MNHSHLLHPHIVQFKEVRITVRFTKQMLCSRADPSVTACTQGSQTVIIQQY